MRWHTAMWSRHALPLLTFVAVLGCGDSPDPEPADPVLHTPRWAFEPWISKDISDRADTEDFVAGFESRDIPVGVLVLDSPWDVNYTMFEPNPSRYPGFEGMVQDLRTRGLRTILWVTQMVNEESFDLEEGGDTYPGPATTFLTARRLNYLINDAQTYFWWKGKGAGVDFHNPEAVAWWHGLQDKLLDMGVAGWKLDFGDSYIDTPTVKTASGEISHQEYSEAYYRDFWEHGARHVGTDDFVTMVRAYDKSYQFEGRFFARPEHAPVVWAGDNRRDWVGLIDAMDHVFRSAAAGYQVVGSDIGGYLDRNDLNLTELVPADVVVFNRWTALGALMPFMQLHGRANLTPWTVDDQGEESAGHYRYWSWFHQALVPFFFSLTEQAYAGGPDVMRPIGEPSTWPGDYRYQLGDAFFVAPVLDETGVRDVALPSGARWYDWWEPSAAPIEGGQVLMDVDTPQMERVPLYVRGGAIIPMDVENDVVGVGRAASQGHRTLLVYPDAEASTFTVHEEQMNMQVDLQQVQDETRLELSGSAMPLLIRVRTEGTITAVSRQGVAMPSLEPWPALSANTEGWWADPDGPYVWLRLANLGTISAALTLSR